MAVKRNTGGKNNRISLRRPGSHSSQNKRKEAFPYREAKEKREKVFPWADVRKYFSAAGIAILGMIIVAALSFCFIYGYRYATTSNYFLLKTVAIQGNTKLSSREILDIAKIDDGANLLALSIDGVEKTISSNPWIKSVSVARVLPETLKVSVEVKNPAFWLLKNGTLHYADIKGKMIAPLDPAEVAPLPILEVEKGAEDIQQALPDLVASLRTAGIPLDMEKISVIRLSSSRAVELFIESGRLKITVGLEEWLANLKRLALTVGDLARRGELQRVRSIRAQGANVWVETAGVAVSG